MEIFEEKSNFKMIYDNNYNITVRKIDDENSNYTHFMKNVDFIVYVNNIIVFIEVKNYNKKYLSLQTEEERKDFFSKFVYRKPENGHSYIYDCIQKARDTFIREYSSNKLESNIHYYVIVSMPDKISNAILRNMRKDLEHYLPIFSKVDDKLYTNQFIHTSNVLSENSWNNYMKNILGIEVNFY
ncbi:DNA-binding protein [Brachyspira hyodysenteriae]|uniref:DNA-binding protein n=1 Tax=Brachyspira hyodysenteriae TaxID=159 RepID=UPI001BFC2273|nr:DNA-binding protein [Brachyspira hyodysenteriae]MBT8718866.1 DNA-binding protein [Brachyspira hyodysenteriae]MBT8734272.1 DNA-binding protein [Brachyspira hyodysenteriae]MBT8736696.1 DNA-binding protein [Brachyspira hyodysenteriae]MBT8739435.1 DNA-binding protein [Brachyspira hyodysenteriae]MBT8741857.1 DNA-binding protein [Brachyspira hyodysenteriae]